MSKINKYEDFKNVNESMTNDSVQDLIQKAKRMVSKDQIQKFIQDNQSEVERVKDLLTDENGSIDYNKVSKFIQKNI
jgi:uncharacterized protein YbcC (UPF0753/DUF2309 family)